MIKKLAKLGVSTLVALMGWIAYGVSGVVKRDPNKIVFGTHTGTFSGNIKAVYLDPEYQSTKRKIFIYRNEKIKESLAKLPGQYEYYSLYSIQGIRHSLTAGIFVYSSYASDISFWLSKGAKLFNVWHGTPLKKIERDVTTGFYSIRNKYENIFKYIYPHLFIRPNELLVCSEYEKRCFRTAFDVTDDVFVEAFPPRLEVLKENYHIVTEKPFVLYTPTWRDDASFCFEKSCDVEKLNAMMNNLGLTFLIKAHPSDKTVHLSQQFSNVRLADKTEDFYGLVSQARIAVTDYSSTMFDCLYCNIPTVLYCPDMDNYLTNSREFYIDIAELPFNLYKSGNEFIQALSKLESISDSNAVGFEPYKKKLV